MSMVKGRFEAKKYNFHKKILALREKKKENF